MSYGPGRRNGPKPNRETCQKESLDNTTVKFVEAVQQDAELIPLLQHEAGCMLARLEESLAELEKSAILTRMEELRPWGWACRSGML